MYRSIALCVSVLALVFSVSAQKTHSAHWSYEGATGPEHWSALSPDFSACQAGRQQSPIDITNPVNSDLSAIEFHYKPAEVKVIDNGHTIQVNYPPGSYIVVEGHRYELVQFHFHHPSEELINGRRYDLVVHMVHQDADQHKAVVAVLANQGPGNLAIDEVLKQLPRIKEKEVSTAGTIDPRDLLPKKRGYYQFKGSLTTPPCTEGVRWIVLKNPVTVSKSALGQFSARYPHNARPAQPRNAREVLASR